MIVTLELHNKFKRSLVVKTEMLGSNQKDDDLDYQLRRARGR